jgi:hypothetical protein
VFFFNHQSVTNVTLGQEFRPNYARLGQNLKKGKIWNSVEVHAIYALFFILGYSTEGLQVLKTFLNSEHEEIYHPVLLAQMVLSPLNSIVDDVLIPLVERECDLELMKNREAKAKLNILFRFDIMCRMLSVLGEFGMEPQFKNQKFVTKLIKNPGFGELAGTKTNSLVHVTGFTAAFLLTLPELFMQWRDQKDGDESNEQQYKVLEFLGQQCHWPSFCNEKVRRSSQNSARGKGSMLSNAKSLPPYSFLPKVFDLTKVFKDCLDGSTQWETNSLCEDTKMIQSSPRKRPADPAEEQAEEKPSAKRARKRPADPAEEQAEDEPSAKRARKLLAKRRKEEEDSKKESKDGYGKPEDDSPSASAVVNSNEDSSEHEEEQSNDRGKLEDQDDEQNEQENSDDQEREQSEQSEPVPRKKKKWPSTGTNVTDIIRTLLYFYKPNRFEEDDPIKKVFEHLQHVLNQDNIFMVFPEAGIHFAQRARKQSEDKPGDGSEEDETLTFMTIDRPS